MYNETLVKKRRLRAVTHCAEFLRKYFSDDSAQWCIARSHLYLRIALRIRNYLQKSFSLLVSDPSGIDCWKKPEVEDLVRLSLDWSVLSEVG
jgi:hypothetical protein